MEAQTYKSRVGRKVNLKDSEKIKYIPLDAEQILSLDDIKTISEKHKIELNDDEITEIQTFYETIVEAVFINHQFNKQEQCKIVELKNEEKGNFIHPGEYRRAS